MVASDENPFLSPDVERHASRHNRGQREPRNWQITLVLILTYALSGVCLGTVILLLVAGVFSLNADIVYLNNWVFSGPAEVRFFVYCLYAVAACFLVLSAVVFLAAIGLHRRRKWGYHLTIGLALLPGVPGFFLPADFKILLIPLGTYSVIVLLVLLQQKNRLQFQHGRAYAE